LEGGLVAVGFTDFGLGGGLGHNGQGGHGKTDVAHDDEDTLGTVRACFPFGFDLLGLDGGGHFQPDEKEGEDAEDDGGNHAGWFREIRVRGKLLHGVANLVAVYKIDNGFVNPTSAISLPFLIWK
jgi:hypothetical protein